MRNFSLLLSLALVGCSQADMKNVELDDIEEVETEQVDSDGDGLSDGREVESGTDPLAAAVEEEKETASCSTSTNPAGLWPMVLMVFPFLRRRRK